MNPEQIKELYGEILFDVSAELGRKKVTIGEMLRWETDTIIRLNKTAGESVDLLVNGRPIAYGEMMVLDERFSVRITEILSKEIIVEKSKHERYE